MWMCGIGLAVSPPPLALYALSSSLRSAPVPYFPMQRRGRGFDAALASCLCPCSCLCLSLCWQGTSVAATVPCPIGKYSNATGLATPSECSQCPAGSYCDVEGLTSPTGPCAPGFVCRAGSWLPAPVASLGDSGGDVCPVGHYCPLGKRPHATRHRAQCPHRHTPSCNGRAPKQTCLRCRAQRRCCAHCCFVQQHVAW
jgi:hypothetical protein